MSERITEQRLNEVQPTAFVDRYRSAIQGILFYLVWFEAVSLAVIGEDIYAAVLLLIFSVLCLVQSRPPRVALVLIAMASAAVDIVIIQVFHASAYKEASLHLFNYPVWVVLMWLAFIGCFDGCLAFLFKAPAWLLFIIGGIGGPVSAYSASRLGALSFPQGIAFGLGVCAIQWEVMLGAMVWAVKVLHLRLLQSTSD